MYGAAKLIVEAVLRYQDRTALLSEVFDDLAEVHRAAGVSDGDSPAETAPEPPAETPADHPAVAQAETPAETEEKP